MPEFSNVAGRLTEVHRFINVPRRWCEQYPARERRELWISQPDGCERKLVVHSRVLPARQGHTVSVLTWGECVIALSNLSTGDRVNFLEVDPPLLMFRRDAVRLLGLVALVCASLILWSDADWVLLALPVVSMLWPLLIGLRWVGRTKLRARGRDWLDNSVQAMQYGSLTRVK